jgi:hypothetical protein
MGRPGSGRPRSKNRGTVEQTIRLDIRSLVRDGYFQPSNVTQGKLTWTGANPDGSSAIISITVDLRDARNSFVDLEFSYGGTPRQQKIAVVPKLMRFGGVRFYFRCWYTDRRCEVMALYRGTFASPKFHKLTYASQTLSPLDRTWRGITKLEERIWPEAKPRSGPRGKRRERFLSRLERFRGRIDGMAINRFA